MAFLLLELDLIARDLSTAGSGSQLSNIILCPILGKQFLIVFLLTCIGNGSVRSTLLEDATSSSGMFVHIVGKVEDIAV